MSLLSETAPPPRNPKLQHCIDEYSGSQIAGNREAVLASINSARSLDLSPLPSKLRKSLASSFDDAESALAMPQEISTSSEAVADASSSYRPIHSKVRGLEREIREQDELIKALETSLSRVSRSGTADTVDSRRASLEDQIAQRQQRKTALEAEIPDEWQSANESFSALTKTERDTRQKFRKTGNSSYEAVAEISAILAATDQLQSMGEKLGSVKGDIESSEPADMIDPLKILSGEFGDIEGASKIKSAVSKARSALKSKKPNKEKALKSIDKALKEYDKEMEWRSEASASLAAPLEEYRKSIQGTLGIRQQSRLDREQALYVARCNAEHRDISLSF